MDPVAALDGYEPLAFVTKRSKRVAELCRTLALGRDIGHVDLSGPICKRLRSGYFGLLRSYRDHNERNGRGWDLPEWDRADDVPGEAGAAVRKWTLESFVETEVPLVRSALAAHLDLLDGANGDRGGRQRRLYNRTLFLVGAEAEAMYNALTRIPKPTRAERRSMKALD